MEMASSLFFPTSLSLSLTKCIAILSFHTISLRFLFSFFFYHLFLQLMFNEFHFMYCRFLNRNICMNSYCVVVALHEWRMHQICPFRKLANSESVKYPPFDGKKLRSMKKKKKLHLLNGVCHFACPANLIWLQ